MPAPIMQSADGSFHYSYNGQAVVDSDYQVIVSTVLNNAPIDIQQLIPMIEHTTETLDAMPVKWSAEAGYCSKANLEHTGGLEADGDTEFFISTGRMKHTDPVPEAPQGQITADATPTQKMARKLKPPEVGRSTRDAKPSWNRCLGRSTLDKANTCCCAGWRRRQGNGI